MSKSKLNENLVVGCLNGELENVQYLLTSSELNEHADIHAGEDTPLYSACQNGYLEIVKYLLASPELKEHADIYSNYASFLPILCDKGNLEIARYFIFDLNIEKTPDIVKFLKNNIKEPNVEKIDGWFKLRELNQSLNEELPIEEVKSNRKPKL